MTTYPISKIRSGEVAVKLTSIEQFKKIAQSDKVTFFRKDKYYTFINDELHDVHNWNITCNFTQIDWEEGKEEVIMDDEKYLQVANNLIFKTVSGKFGLTSIDEHDQVDGYYDTYKEAFFSLKLIMQLKELSTIKSENERLKEEKKKLQKEVTDYKLSINLFGLGNSSTPSPNQELSLRQRMAWELVKNNIDTHKGRFVTSDVTIGDSYAIVNDFLNYK